MTLNKYILALTGIFSGLLLSAQEDLSARQAVFKALENNYQIQIAEKQYETSEMNNSWMGANAFPSVTLQAAQNNTIQDNTNNPLTFTPGLILMQNFNPSLSANWNIFSGFAVMITKKQLEQLETQSANNMNAVIESTIQDVLKAYYTAQLQNERTKLLSSMLSFSRDKYLYYQIKEKYSTSTSLESLQFKNQYFTDSTNVLLQQISTDNAMRNLKLLMNDSTAVQYALTDPLEIDLNMIDIETALGELVSNNHNLKNQYINLEQQKLNTSLKRSFLYPTLSFQAGVNPTWNNIREIQNNTIDLSTQSLTYYGNFNLRYTLFNNWQNKRAVEVARIQEDIAEIQIEEMEQTLSNTMMNLVELFQARNQLVTISTQNLDYAKKAYLLALNRYEVGSINSIDLTTFQTAYQNTMIQHYENLFNKLDTYLEIYRMMGRLSLEYAE